MAPVASLAEPGPGEASVVFVRPVSACDGVTYSVIVDEQGHFVGNMPPGTRLASSVTPGKHTFFAWSCGLNDMRVEQLPPGFIAVGAATVDVLPGQTQYVAIMRPPPCGNRAWPTHWRMRRVPRNSGLWPDLVGWLGSTAPLVADLAAGQASLDENPALLKTYLELGQRTLRIHDEIRDEARALEDGDAPTTSARRNSPRPQRPRLVADRHHPHLERQPPATSRGFRIDPTVNATRLAT
jgi:hypothetical protein